LHLLRKSDAALATGVNVSTAQVTTAIALPQPTPCTHTFWLPAIVGTSMPRIRFRARRRKKSGAFENRGAGSHVWM
jgi:hypothetical protein